MTGAGKEVYDLIIVGGGIHGAGVAQAAAANGLSVLVLEKNAVASGTSSRSSKLIHGGLRYLESMQFGLVRECLRERALLLRLAPDLVKLRPFYFPVYSNSRRRPWQLRAGLTLYSLLAGLAEASRFEHIAPSVWPTLDHLETRKLLAVYRYHDAQTDDAALTRAVMYSATRLGAELLLKTELMRAHIADDHCLVYFRQDGTTSERHCRVLINAAGPWVNHVLGRMTPHQSARAIDLVQGTHIVLPGQLYEGNYYLEAPQDRRLVFAMPWQGHVLVGTTETHYAGQPDDVRPLPAEKRYLLETLASYFPQYRQMDERSILSAFAGLRVLPHSEKSSFNRPRETVMHTDRRSHPRVLTIYGGKLTAYRATAEKVLSIIRSSTPYRKIIADPKQLQLEPGH